jgi:hypothetical protein
MSDVPSPFDKTFHLVTYPPDVHFASILFATTSGTIDVAAMNPNAASKVLSLRPESPIYNLNNTACAGSLIVPLGLQPSIADVVVLTFVNNSKDDGTITAAVALDFEPEKNQYRFHITQPLSKGQTTFVHIVLKQV